MELYKARIQILVVCANGDSKDNVDTTNNIIRTFYSNTISRPSYNITSVNPDKPEKNILYDYHIQGTFGALDFKLDNKYDIVIFQGCMTGVPNPMNIFDQPNTLETLFNCLKLNGFWLNLTNGYAIGPIETSQQEREDATKKLKHDIEKNFLRTSQYDVSINIPFGLKQQYDVWRKIGNEYCKVVSFTNNNNTEKKHGIFITSRILDIDDA